jgi:predicted nucleic acid-binding protein
MEQDSVVIDTTLWLHGFQKAKHEKFTRLTADYNVIIYTCPQLTDEVSRNLLYNPYFKKYINNPQEHIDFFREITLNHNIEQRFDRY